jgi:septal ring factor EnvC (AmiA/AmiB activator)
MATGGRKQPEPGVVERLSKRGEETLARLAEELGRNERVADALGKAVSAKGRLDTASRRALGQVGLAAADELKDLRAQIAKLEKRLARLEGGAAKQTAKRAETKKTASAKKGTTRVKSDQEKAPSPPPGRALGGGSGRGSSAG